MEMKHKTISHSKAAEDVARNEVEVVTARLMDQMGFTHGTHHTVDLLSDLTVRYLGKLCDNVRLIKEHCGRGNVVIKDVQFAYEKMQIDTDEINEYMRQNRPLKPRTVPAFPAIPPKKNTKTMKIAPPCEKEREHFPSWVPPVYKTNLATTATSSTSTIKNATDIIPDFCSFSAYSLGIIRNKNGKELLTPKTEQDIHGLMRPPSQSYLNTDIVEFRPPSSLSKVPLFKRRKRRVENILSNAEVGDRKNLSANISPTLYTAKDLAYDHRPVMISIHTGTAAPLLTKTEVPIPQSTLTHDILNGEYPPMQSPLRIAQIAILKSSFTLQSELTPELIKAFEFINREAIVNQQQSVQPIQEFAAPPVPPETVYKIIKQEAPPGVIAPLKIKITRTSGEPSPTITSQQSSDDINSPKIKRHKHKKKKHKKDKHQDQPVEEVVPESPRPRIRLKIRLGTE